MKAGDLVRLKSGGPLMTVERINFGTLFPSASCTWWKEEEKTFDAETFTVEALEIVGED
jgi:uncharacterized protein YodC (DUF2158 family)